MLQYSEEVRCVFVTTHVGYAEVPHLLSQERIIDVIELASEAMERIRKRNQDCSAADSTPMLARTVSLVTERKNKSSYPPLKKSESAAST